MYSLFSRFSVAGIIGTLRWEMRWKTSCAMDWSDLDSANHSNYSYRPQYLPVKSHPKRMHRMSAPPTDVPRNCWIRKLCGVEGGNAYSRYKFIDHKRPAVLMLHEKTISMQVLRCDWMFNATFWRGAFVSSSGSVHGRLIVVFCQKNQKQPTTKGEILCL
jgi:hypothetical protein